MSNPRRKVTAASAKDLKAVFRRLQGIFFALSVAGVMLLQGCAPQIKEHSKICAGKDNLFQSISAVKENYHNAESFKAHGKCFLEYYSGGKKHRENFPVKLWVHPPYDIYLQGDVAFNPKGIMLGSNEKRFWLAIKPEEVSSYWWGKWSQQKEMTDIPVNPRILLEALGMVKIEMADNWSLSNQGPYDILTRKTADGRVQKKIYIYCCDYVISKIEYFDSAGKVRFIAQMDNYTGIGAHFLVPRLIKITGRKDKGKAPAIRINLSYVQKEEFSRKQLDAIFKRPEPHGYKHTYILINGEPVELIR